MKSVVALVGVATVVLCLVAVPRAAVAQSSPNGTATTTSPATAAPQYASCCPNAPSYIAWDNGGSGSVMLNNGEGLVRNKSVVTIAAWVRMSPEQQSNSYIISKTPASWTTESAGFGLYWDHVNARLQLELTTDSGKTLPLNAAGTARGAIFVPNNNWRLITLEINSQTGTIQVRVDLVPEMSLTFTPLATSSITNSAPLSVGCQYYFQSCINGNIGDVFYFNRSLSGSEVMSLFQYRQCPPQLYLPNPNPSLSCAAPLPGVRMYTRDPNNEFAEMGPTGSRPTQLTLQAVNDPPFQWFESTVAAVIGNQSWSSAQQGSFTVVVPALPQGSGAFVATMAVAAKSAESVTSASVFTLQTSALVGPISCPFQVGQSAAPPCTFVLPAASNSVVSFTFTSDIAADVNSLTLKPYGAVALEVDNTAGGNFGWVGSSVNGLILGESANTNFALGIVPSNATTCAAASMAITISRPELMPWTFSLITPPATTGTYTFCMFPTGDANQGYMLASAPLFTQAQLTIVPLPMGGAPLPSSWLLNLLHLGSTYGSRINNARINVDYFNALPGGEANIQPSIYDTFDRNMTTNLTWTPMSVTDGNWGFSTVNSWVQYAAVAIYSPTAQSITMSVRHQAGVRVWVDGKVVLANDVADAGLIEVTNPIPITAGWHQIIFKYARKTGGSYFYARIDRGVGLSWAYQLPGAKGADNVPYKDTCASVSVASTLCASGTVFDEEECFNMGCCWLNNATMCVAPAGDLLPYRMDGRCGDAFPAPGAVIGQCNKNSRYHVSCCSTYNWCGNSTLHCSCQGCVDYLYELYPRSRFLPLITPDGGFNCASTTPVFFGNRSLIGCQQQCNYDAQCRGFTYSTTGQCYHWYQQCQFSKRDATVMSAQRRFNNCSFRNDCPGQNCRCQTTWHYTTLGGWHDEPTCRQECANSFYCLGYNWLNGTCNMWATPCPTHLITVPYPASYMIYTCPGIADAMPVQPSNATMAGTTMSKILGCFDDADGNLLFDSPSGDTYPNLYTGTQLMTPQVCESYCLSVGALFFALYNGSKCMCGMRQMKDHITSRVSYNGRCLKHCPGNATLACGGVDASILYSISPPTAGCPQGAYRFRNTCYFLNTKLLNYSAATAACNAMGGQLASAPDIPTAQFTLALPFFKNVSDQYTTYFTWIGGAADNQRTRFQWVDGSGWSVSSWRWGEPNDLSGELCLQGFSNYPTPWIWKGTWNNANCASALISVCALPVAPNTFLGPAIAVASNAGRVACAAQAPPQFTVNLLAAWSLGQNLEPASSDQGTPLVFVANNNSGVGVTPSFVQIKPIGGAIILQGNAYLNASTNASFNRQSDTLSVCAWVTVKTVNDATIVAKNMDYADQFPFNPRTNYQYALRVQGGRFCFYNSYDQICTVNTRVNVNQEYYVCGTGSAAIMTIHVNGIRDAANALFGMTQYFISSTPLIIGAEATRTDSSKVTAYLNGMVAMVMVFNAQLQDSMIAGLYNCAVNGNGVTLPIYAGQANTVQLSGMGLYTLTSALVTSSSCTGQGAIAPLLNAGTEFAQLAIPSSAVANGVTSSLRVCLNSLQAVGTGAYPIDAGITLAPVSITNFVGSSATVKAGGQRLYFTYNVTSETPQTFTIAGSNLDAQQGVALAGDQLCTMPVSSASIMFNLRSGMADVLFMRPATPLATLYLCWVASIAPGATMYPTGLALEVTYGAEVETIVVSDGSMAFTPAVFATGFNGDHFNYVRPCSALDNFLGAVVLQVTVGSFTDFYTMPVNGSACDFLSGKKPMALYSPIDPTSSGFDGTYYTVPAGPPGWLGGSAAGYPADARTYLNFWGSTNVNNEGACCQTAPQQQLAWGRAFSIVAKSIPKASTFLQLPYAPTAIYPGTSTIVFANVVNAWGNVIVNPGYMTMFTLTCGTRSTKTAFGHGGVALSVTPAITSAGQSVTCNVTAQTQTAFLWKTFVMAVYPLPAADTVPIDPSSPVTNLLELGLPPQGLVPMVMGGGLDEDLLAGAGGEANVRPQPGQQMACSDNVSSVLVWTAANQVDGVFGNYLGINGLVGYFAFALYSPIDQVITTTLSVNISGAVYIAGYRRLYTTRQGTSTSAPFTLSSGWNQVIVKLQSAHWGQATPYMMIQFTGIALLSRFGMPTSVPEGATELEYGARFTSMLHLGSVEAVVVASMNADPVSVSSMPGDGTDAAGYTWTATSTFDGEWLVPALPAVNPVPSISYYAVAVFSSLDYMYGFQFTFQGPFQVLQDGVFVVDMPANVKNVSQGISLFVGAGWHQWIIKVGVAIVETTFEIKVLDMGLSYALSVPSPAPIGGFPLNAGPIGNFMQLEGPMPGVQGGEFTTIPYAVPLNGSLGASAIPLTVNPRVNDPQTIVIPTTGKAIPFFTWQARASARGNWGGDYGVSGSWDSYFALQIYSPRQQTISPQLLHSFDAQLYLDGTLVTSVVGAQAEQLALGQQFPISVGWHTLLARLQAPPLFHPVSYMTNVTSASAQSKCTLEKRELCHIQAYCPFGMPRVDGLSTPANHAGQTVWAPVALDIGVPRTWVQVKGPAVCSTTTVMPAAAQVNFFACCGDANVPAARLAVELWGDSLYAAYQRPLPPLPSVQVTIINASSTTPTLILAASNASYVIMFTTNGATPGFNTGSRYTVPIKVMAPTTFSVVVITSDGTQTSSVSTFEVAPASKVVPMRTIFVAGSSTPVLFSGTGPVDQFIVIRQGDTRIPDITNSFTYAARITPDSNFTGLLKPNSAGYVTIPSFLAAGAYAVYHFDPLSQTLATPGLLVTATLTIAVPTVQPATIVASATANIQVTNGPVPGDAIVMALVTLTAAQCTARCNSLVVVVPLGNIGPSGETIVDLSQPGRVTCACYLPLASAPAGFNGPWSALATNITVTPTSSGPTPSASPTPVPSGSPTASPTPVPSGRPTASPTPVPSGVPTASPTPVPSGVPTASPTPVPSGVPVTPAPSGAPVPADSVIGWNAPTVIKTGSTIQVLGSFAQFPATSYTVSFLPTATSAAPEGTGVGPTCAVTSGTTKYLLCTVTVRAGVSGQWKLAVQNPSNTIVMPTVLSQLTLVPPSPTVTGVTGGCANDATQCINGAVITINGANFDWVTFDNNAVVLAPLSGATQGASCTVSSVHYTQLTCTLGIPPQLQPNSQFDMSVSVTFSTAMPPLVSSVFGTLTLGVPTGSNMKGITGNAAQDSPAPAPPPSGGNDKLLVIAVAVLGVLLVCAIGGVVYFRRARKQVYRTTDGAAAEDGYLPMQPAAA